MTTIAPTTALETTSSTRLARWVRIGWWCTVISLVWNVTEGVIAVWAGEVADSVALVGFGINSFIETASAAVIAWRLWTAREAARTDASERKAMRWMSGLLWVLAAYIASESMRRLAGWGPESRESVVGLVLTAVSLVVMPGLYLAKRRVARELNSAAVRADGVQTLACWWLSLATFVGLAMNAALGWAWADPVAGLLLVPFIVKEARSAWCGEACGCAAGGCAGGRG
ncbi:hypothetical protein PHYC_00558 [Phycisphaerales bacterium]|nr:hypothetical protein PHYC_00558 [Phycisphaerales bacterium]